MKLVNVSIIVAVLLINMNIMENACKVARMEHIMNINVNVNYKIALNAHQFL